MLTKKLLMKKMYEDYENTLEAHQLVLGHCKDDPEMYAKISEECQKSAEKYQQTLKKLNVLCLLTDIILIASIISTFGGLIGDKLVLVGQFVTLACLLTCAVISKNKATHLYIVSALVILAVIVTKYIL